MSKEDIRISREQFKDISCVLMENQRLRVTFIPESGSKIQSIYDKKLCREYLVQNSAKNFIRSSYDSRFSDGDVSGFDEIFPSIEECYYPSGPWKGTRIPDHGEVWALPWKYEISENTVIMKVSGVRFPYMLKKTVSFINDNIIRIKYMASNISNFDLYFSWAPHILLLSEQDMEIILPKSVNEVISTCSVNNKLGKFGTLHPWPVTEVKNEAYDISKIYPGYPGRCEKFYATGEVKEGWCALFDSSKRNTIGLSYPIDKVPYLGVWKGIIGKHNVTALEPCTGDLDYLNTAIQWNRVNVIKACSEYEWYFNLTFDTVNEINIIDERGVIH